MKSKLDKDPVVLDKIEPIGKKIVEKLAKVVKNDEPISKKDGPVMIGPLPNVGEEIYNVFTKLKKKIGK